jgi:hypothetical protein
VVTGNLRLRRWDQTGPSATVNGVAMGASFLPLEDGVEARFSDGAKTYRTGDFWLVPARSSRADIEWPRDPTNTSITLPKPRDGIRHYYCPLGILTLAATGPGGALVFTATDCRKLFPPLTALTSFVYVSGDGQEARPGHRAPMPLQVGVCDTQGPVQGAMVQFRVIVGAGRVRLNALVGTTITVPTDADGIAQCDFELSAEPNFPVQRVEATLVETVHTALNLPIRFNANYSFADEVGYRPPTCDVVVPNVKSVQQQLRDQIPNWPPVDAAGNTTVKDILDALLCKLEARKLPYDPAGTKARWEDIAEAVGVLPTTVQQALDQLVNNLESTDIGYNPSCQGVPGTILDRLGIPDDRSSKVSEILDRLLCKLNATHIPIDRATLVCAGLQGPNVQTVQQALEALCVERRVSVTHGEFTFTNVPANGLRVSTAIEHGHGAVPVTISLAFTIVTNGLEDQFIVQGPLHERAWGISLGSFIERDALDRFTIAMRDERPAAPGGGAPRSWNVRWWAIPATAQRPKLGTIGRLAGTVLEAFVLERVRTQPGLQPTAEAADSFGITLAELNTTLTTMRTGNRLVARGGRFFAPGQ